MKKKYSKLYGHNDGYFHKLSSKFDYKILKLIRKG